MVQYDDTASDEAVRIYDRGFDFAEPATFGEYQLTYRSGDMVVPRLEAAEPLGLELQDFARSIREGCKPRSHAGLGLEIVRVLEAAHASLISSGTPVALTSSPAALQRTAGDGNGHHPDIDDANGGARDFTLAHFLRNGDAAGQRRGSTGNGVNAESPGSRLAPTE
jgi:hypothetical protein